MLLLEHFFSSMYIPNADSFQVAMWNEAYNNICYGLMPLIKRTHLMSICYLPLEQECADVGV